MVKTDMELCYVAGLFDGEGSIGISFRKNPMQYWLSVSLSNTHKETIDWLAEGFGGHIRVDNKGRVGKVRRVCWVWNVVCRDASGFLKLVLPYLRVKRKQAELAIEFQSYMKRRGSIGLSNEELDKRKCFRAMISRLNHGLC